LPAEDDRKYMKSSQSQRLYNFSAPFYDYLLGKTEESRFALWRKLLWSKVTGTRILEVGVGTGLSFSYYPAEAEIMAIDFSQNMLKRAQSRAWTNKVQVDLKLMDVEDMAFQDNSFDAVVASLVFCAVPNPGLGLEEVKRVVRSGGQVLLLEHVLSDTAWMAPLMKMIDFPLGGLTGEHISRRTVETVQKSGLVVERVTRLTSLFRLIEARKRQIYV
jgi:phosphatidylethanolamine/phosphatidyl-N-methylethanolamine N-methyltransferase